LKPVAEAEKAAGIMSYATEGEPCAARVKSRAGDFVVNEEIEFGELSSTEVHGHYPLYRIEKRNIDTPHMAGELSEALKSRVSFGGMKDKKAVAIQYATPLSLRGSRPAKVEREKFTATLVGYVPRPISRGTVRGNRFEITLRECAPRIEETLVEVFRLAEAKKLPNFYGLQRFGATGAGTNRVGKAMVMGDFEGAVRLMLTSPGASDEQSASAAESFESGEYEEGARRLPPEKDIERAVARQLSKRPLDWIGALRAVPLRIRRLFVQAYQSALFNKTLSRALDRGEDIAGVLHGDNWAEVSEDGLVTLRVMGVRDPPTPKSVPMVQMAGYAFRDYGSRFDACALEAMRSEGISPPQFFVKEMQEVSGEGGFRRPHMAVRDSSWDLEGDVAHVRFTLGRGQYATILLREVIKPQDPAAAGLS
jgi:tRNA pseudouridine13 synthase